MPTIKKAMKGSRDAMLALYNKNKARVCSLASFLLGDAEAENAGVQIMKNVWKEVLDGRYASDEAFSAALMQKTLVYCKSRVERKDTGALRMNANKVYDRAEYDLSDGKTLPALARFVLAMRVVCPNAFPLSEGAKLFGANTAVFTEVCDAEMEKISRAASAVGTTAEALCASAVEATVTPSASDDEKIFSQIDALVAPFEAAAKKRGKVIGLSAVAGLLLVAIIVCAIVLPPMFDTTYYADITIKDYGTITVVLDDESAPITVNNFVTLAKEGFYDGLTFHRIIEGFMMQGGDPKGDGTGGKVDANGKKVTIKGEFTQNGVDNRISHVRGVISMARANDPDSASSQFFIVHQDNTDSLDGKYAGFGHVVSGIEIVDAICEGVKSGNNGAVDKSFQPVIESIRIREE